MKYLYILICSLWTLTVCSQQQENENFRYHLFFNNHTDVPNFVQQGNYLVYQGTDRNLEDLFDNHPVVSFYQAYPNSISAANRKAYYLETDGEDMLQLLETNFAGKAYYVERLNDIELTNQFSSAIRASFKKSINTKGPFDASYVNASTASNLLLSYPNDYGPTAPGLNAGVFNRSELDYMGAPEAWDIATGDNITMVISDSRINVDDTEFANKISFFEPDASQNQTFNGSTYHKHGTAVAGIALAQGNNEQGTVGVSYDSDVIMTNFQGLTALENFIELAKNGYRVFNMSWASYNNNFHPNSMWEEKIDSLVNYYGAVLIASAGNRLSTQTETDYYSYNEDTANNTLYAAYIGEQVAWPASYDGVISVGNINHSWEINDPAAPSNMFFSNGTIQSGQSFVKDSYASNVNITDPTNPIGLIYNGYERYAPLPDGSGQQLISPLGIVNTTTNNDYVDILSAADLTMNYADYSYYQTVGYLTYGGTTSAAAPYVSGTAALMIDANGCLDGLEVDQILKLTAKDIEHMPINAPFFGKIGAGKLEIGKAVTFADAIKQPNGVARIEDHIFYRWDFNLDNIYNILTMENVRFIDDANVNFVAKNSINLIDEVLLEPNNGKSITLDIDPAMVACTPYPDPIGLPGDDDDKKNPNAEDKLGAYLAYPTLVDRQINITKKQLDAKQITRVMVFDIFNQLVFEKDNITQEDIVLELAGLSEGIYILKGYSIQGDELLTTKIVKK